MQILRKYQIDIVFLFFGLTIVIWTIFFIIKNYGADPHDYEWFIAAPLLAIYSLGLWQIREKINQHDKRSITGRTLFYWIVLGLVIFFSYASPLPAKDYWSIELSFIIFTVFLADSYWDFRKMTLRSIIKR